jgi:hypothetical protein
VSVENLKKYGQLCAEDEEVRHRAKGIGIMDVEGQIAYARSLGLEFSKEDFVDLSKEAGMGKHDEISDEDLKGVAGGFSISIVPTVDHSPFDPPPFTSIW